MDALPPSIVSPIRASQRRPRVSVAAAVAAGIALLAIVETTTALVAPTRAPRDADWRAAATWVRQSYQKGDLLVAAPLWADPVLRLHFGDLLPAKIAARLDHETFGRIWELSQRGADAPEVAGARLTQERTFGHLRARLYERTPLVLTYGFVDNWAHAHVTREQAGHPPVVCAVQSGQQQCPGIGYNFVRPRILEIGNTLRSALYAQPVPGATVALEYPNVALGRELAVGGGLHNVWLRKGGDGTVWLRVLIDGKELGRFESTNRSGWKLVRFDTSAQRGHAGTVRFEITSAKPYSRHFGFAAEARGL